MTDAECLEAVRRLLRLADSYSLAELVVEEGGVRITIRGGEDPAVGTGAVVVPADSLLAEIRPEAARFPVIASPMTAKAFTDSAIASLVPMKRAGQPDEVAALVGFLASDEASYISGQVVAIDGAMT